MTLHLVLGGIRSGKSARAEHLAAGSGGPVVYIATGSAADEEMRERIAAHRERRPGSWRTVETTDIAAALRAAPPDACVLIDDLDGWVTDRMFEGRLWTEDPVARLDEAQRAAWKRILAEAADWRDLARSRAARVVVAAGQPGGGLVPVSASSRRWLDLHGAVVQSISEAADTCELVVAGRAVPLPAPEAPPQAEAGDRLRDHGDTQVPEGAVDLAVNVLEGPPQWLADRLAAAVRDLAAYPDQRAARAAAASRHGRAASECMVLDGAAEGFWMLAQVLRPRLAVCVHPTFTEGEAALRSAGVPVRRVFRESEHWTFDPADVPDEADFVLLTRPDNPTGALDPVAAVERLCRPGRTVVVDEAFADFLPPFGDAPDAAPAVADDLAGRGDLPGLVVIRSLTKLWGLAGLRVGYLLADPDTVARLDAARQPWPVGSLALEAIEACVAAEAERAERAGLVAERRAFLIEALSGIAGLRVWPAAANFVLIRTERTDLRERLLQEGFALRRGETFPGLDAHYLRIAVRDGATAEELRSAIIRTLEQHR
ncbi:Rv2231c family pyridoxal phosphate-dependent protein CobC [Glycomyces sp. TRM65418]|uniref:Rv2231c family pyridoxal phosphate-dependent protein CobC n=1 Tax=Glycomyces sp. TRM65418 TaxID=2867006 RepID=UPI001CE66CBE|nr:Rv2231c family pyridoxal phosphate-dependent protein CobC [Glycomyces sp. TRM65418]MCC3764539.1 Rv2231c family pyridoxal phosphate-dependent protein CobC [Glycomyces sp. TRM65418]QZD54206.1 Rv2231c family pyridoxal phosphate-dependent protein CobC [Glycomyces sp. TRM65418]